MSHPGGVRPLVALSLLALPTACGNANEAGRVERTDSAGVALITTRGSDIALDWRFEPVLDLGGEDEGPEAFVRIHETSIGTDADGMLYVLDAGSKSITVFDHAGRALRTFGRGGGGPGEFGFPSDLAVAVDGTVGVYDFAVRGLVRFDRNGTVLPVRPLPGTTRKFALAGDAVVGAFRNAVVQDSAELRLLVVSMADTVTLARRTLADARAIEVACMRLSMPLIYSEEMGWSARGDTVIAALSHEYAIDVFVAGRRVAQWRRDDAPIPATTALAAIEIGTDSMRLQAGGNRCAVPAADAAERIGYTPFTPIVKDMIIAPDGMVWVLRRTTSPGETRIDVLGPDGSYTGTLPAGTPMPAAFRGPDEIITVEQDSLDLRHINVYRIVRRVS